jgi:hypothetical protein
MLEISNMGITSYYFHSVPKAFQPLTYGKLRALLNVLQADILLVRINALLHVTQLKDRSHPLSMIHDYLHVFSAFVITIKMEN